MRALANLFKALADETRLRILALLADCDELCVCDIEQVLGITQSKASRHLRYLANVGLVEGRREGVWMHYRIPTGLDAAARAVLVSLDVALPEAETDRLRQSLFAWLEAKERAAAACAVPDEPDIKLAGQAPEAAA